MKDSQHMLHTLLEEIFFSNYIFFQIYNKLPLRKNIVSLVRNGSNSKRLSFNAHENDDLIHPLSNL